jgi:hypothetical protein
MAMGQQHQESGRVRLYQFPERIRAAGKGAMNQPDWVNRALTVGHSRFIPRC